MPPTAPAPSRKATMGRSVDEDIGLPSVHRSRSFGGGERGSEALFLAIVTGAFPEARMSDARRAMPADHLAVLAFAQNVVNEEILGDRNVTLHAENLGDVRDTARAIAQALGLHNHIDRRADHLADGPGRQREAACPDHRLDAG